MLRVLVYKIHFYIIIYEYLKLVNTNVDVKHRMLGLQICKFQQILPTKLSLSTAYFMVQHF